MPDLEIRAIPAEVRAVNEDGTRTVEGRAIVYDSWSVDLGGFRERLLPGSARLEPDLRAYYSHDSAKPLASMAGGTLEAIDDGSGVSMRAAVDPRITWVADMLLAMERGDVNGMSFAFRVKPEDEEWKIGTDGVPERTIRSMTVSELSVVSEPAYPATSAYARSRAEEVRSAAFAPEDSPASGDAPESVVFESVPDADTAPAKTYLIAGKVVTFPEKG